MSRPAQRGVRPKDLYLLRTVVDPQISPDGKRVAYVVTWPDRDADETRMSVYIAALDGRVTARRFTQGNKDHSPRWSPDGRYLAFVSDRGEKNQLFIAPLDGGEARQVTKAKHGISNPAWSPDGKLIAYMARTGDYKPLKERSPVEKSAPRVIRNLRYKLDGIGFFDERRTHIFTVSVSPVRRSRSQTGTGTTTSRRGRPMARQSRSFPTESRNTRDNGALTSGPSRLKAAVPESSPEAAGRRSARRSHPTAGISRLLGTRTRMQALRRTSI